MPNKKISVLMVEDDFWNYDVIKCQLEIKNIKVDAWVKTLEDAVNILADRDFDIITVDLGLGKDEMGGIEVIKAVKKISQARIVVLSNYSLDSHTIKRCAESGSDDYHSKLDIDSLILCICKLMDGTNISAYQNEAIREDQLTEKQKEIYNDLIENENIEVKDIAKKHDISYKRAWSLKNEVIDIVGDIKRLYRVKYNKNGKI